MTETEKTTVPEGFNAQYEDGVLTVEGEGGELDKTMEHALVDVTVDDDEIVFCTESSKRNVTSILGTFKSHAENMIEGLQDEHVYKMKGVYAHFPMTIKKQGNEVHIENFMGERADRVIEIMDGVEVDVNGDDLELRSADKDAVAQTAARIEQICFKGDRDPRTFQDGVYITEGDTE
jgi:large subunit ribosomal protein L6